MRINISSLFLSVTPDENDHQTSGISHFYSDFSYVPLLSLLGSSLIIPLTALSGPPRISWAQSCFQYGSKKAENLWGKKSQEKKHALELKMAHLTSKRLASLFNDNSDGLSSSSSTKPLSRSSSTTSSFVEHVSIADFFSAESSSAPSSSSESVLATSSVDYTPTYTFSGLNRV
ncbi:hypothetical protein PoB_004578600 [Plakobranchus ocellatus]|uniref:Uncharacterized protein n=1 Tax=Plakobranchus ocellatus TaxID=259542 RepID=A0AAV4BFS4_9GAST|nr:hypothetical protein PoB_004578600 [Plakobranchus ocellatus]